MCGIAKFPTNVLHLPHVAMSGVLSPKPVTAQYVNDIDVGMRLSIEQAKN
jgi:hypothetical protein